MDEKEALVTLQVKVDKLTHKRLRKQAAILGVDRKVVYSKALEWAGRNHAFKLSLREFVERAGLGW